MLPHKRNKFGLTEHTAFQVEDHDGSIIPEENFSPSDTVLPRRKASFFFQ